MTPPTSHSSGLDVCNNKHRFLCLRGGLYFPVCISSEFACDGHNNCPVAGDDENPEECEAMALKGGLLLADPDSSEERHQPNPHHVIEAILKKAVLKTLTEVKSGKRETTSTTTSQPGVMTLTFRDMSDIILKKLLSNSKRDQLADPTNSTMITTTIKPPWQDSSEGKPLLLQGKPLLLQYANTRSVEGYVLHIFSNILHDQTDKNYQIIIIHYSSSVSMHNLH
jgi:hypothetical protein